MNEIMVATLRNLVGKWTINGVFMLSKDEFLNSNLRNSSDSEQTTTVLQKMALILISTHYQRTLLSIDVLC